jgi:DNA-binding response OmpR family regulator
MNDIRPRTLIVSSESDFGAALALGIRSGGGDAHCAFSFDDAADVVRHEQHDLIIADLATTSFATNAVIAMGEAVRETGARLVVLTRNVNSDASLCAELLGASGCLSRSIPLAELSSRLQFISRHAARNRSCGIVFDYLSRPDSRAVSS